MAQTELFNRYIWLVDLINQHDGITREEINRRWSKSHLNGDKESEIPERTFHRHKEAIKELFDIDIICNRKGNKTYHLSNRAGLQQNGVKERLLNIFAIKNLLEESRELEDRILFEAIPSGQQYLTFILEAMRGGKVIRIDYQSFHMCESRLHIIEPYSLKIYKQRWYLLAHRVDRDVIRIFALDRIKRIDDTGDKFELPESFDAQKYFENSIGIIVEDNCNPEPVVICASNGQQDYLRSLPLHRSQIEIKTGKNEAIFQLFVQPNYDLIQELLRYGYDVTVIKPEWFRNRFKETVKRMIENYKDDVK